MPANMHITGANTNIKRTITPYNIVKICWLQKTLATIHVADIHPYNELLIIGSVVGTHGQMSCCSLPACG